MKKIFYFIIGLAFICLVVWLGFQSAKDARFVLWFGLASALIAPIGLNLLTATFSPNNKKLFSDLSRLSTVPEISNLIAEAESREARIKLLQQQQQRLEEIINFETERRALESRKDWLENNAISILHDLKIIEKELEELNIKIQQSPVSKQLEELNERIKSTREGAMVVNLGSNKFLIRESDFGWIPIPPFILRTMIYLLIPIMIEITQKLSKHVKKTLKYVKKIHNNNKNTQ